MKKLIALALVCLICMASALAAEWPEGRSPGQPYAGVREVDLNEKMGYIILYPRAKLPAQHFCDVLEMYLPREDLVLNEGTVRLYTEDGVELCAVDFTDPEAVELRALTESELESLMWGSGMCIEMQLPVSLDLDAGYYVLTDEGCFTALDGKLTSLAITSPEAWLPVVTGDYGIGGLYYCAPAEEAAPAEEGEAEEDAQSAVPEFKTHPEVGDEIHFNVKLSGDAKYAVIHSDNGSVYFDQTEFSESGAAVGTVTGEEVRWGVVFLDENGELIEDMKLSK